MEMEVKKMTPQEVLFNWTVDDYDYVVQSSTDGRCYPCKEEDIPQGAIDSYAPIVSIEAVEMLQNSIAEGWSY